MKQHEYRTANVCMIPYPLYFPAMKEPHIKCIVTSETVANQHFDQFVECQYSVYKDIYIYNQPHNITNDYCQNNTGKLAILQQQKGQQKKRASIINNCNR